MTIKEFQEDVKSRIINKSKYDKHLKVFPDIFSVKSEESMTMPVPEFYNEIINNIRRNEPDEKKVEWLEDDLNYVLDSEIIIYNPKILKKRIREPRGGARGKKHRKSRKNRRKSRKHRIKSRKHGRKYK